MTATALLFILARILFNSCRYFYSHLMFQCLVPTVRRQEKSNFLAKCVQREVTWHHLAHFLLPSSPICPSIRPPLHISVEPSICSLLKLLPVARWRLFVGLVWMDNESLFYGACSQNNHFVVCVWWEMSTANLKQLLLTSHIFQIKAMCIWKVELWLRYVKRIFCFVLS
jgi:hypothetical protein